MITKLLLIAALLGDLSVPVYGTVWRDMDFPLVQAKLGLLDKPDYDYTQMGLLFPQDDTTEIAYLSRQLNHGWEPGSCVKPHLHYHQTTAAAAVWRFDFRVVENGEAPGGFTTYTSTGVLFSYVSGTLLQIALWSEICLSGIVGTSAVIDIKLYRDDNVVTGDVLAKSFDLHIRVDQPGSRQEYAH